MGRSFRGLVAARRARYLASDAQVVYLRRLLDEAFARHVDHGTGLDRHHLESTTREYASTAIEQLKRALGKTQEISP